LGYVVPIGVLRGGGSTAPLALALREGKEVGGERGDGCFFDEAGFEDGATFLDQESISFFLFAFFFFIGEGGGGGGGGGGEGGGGGGGGRMA